MFKINLYVTYRHYFIDITALNKEKLENEYLVLELKNRVLYGIYKPKIITLEIAKNIILSRQEYCEGKAYASMANIIKVSKVTKEARDYFSSPEGTKGILAGAILTDSTFQTTMANFFLKVTSPQIPTKLFTSKEKAEEWCRQFIK